MALTIIFAAGSCSWGTDTDRATRDLDADVTVAAWPQQAGVSVIRVDTGGGLPSPEVAPERFADVPDFVLFGDGLAVWREGGTFRSARLDPDGVRTVLGWATAAGLADDGGARAGEPKVYDVPSTRFDLTSAAGTVTTVLRAPGLDPDTLGLSREEILTRELLGELRVRLSSLADFVPANRFEAGPGPLQVPAWEVLGRRATTYPDLTGDEPAWDLTEPIAGCRRVTGEDLGRLEARLAKLGRDPGAGSLWAFADRRWVVFARPLIPGSPEPCPVEPQGDATTGP